jgi:hypothetical protein
MMVIATEHRAGEGSLLDLVEFGHQLGEERVSSLGVYNANAIVRWPSRDQGLKRAGPAENIGLSALTAQRFLRQNLPIADSRIARDLRQSP